MSHEDACVAARVQSRDRLLAAIIEEVAVRGYDATTVAEVARRAGVTEAEFAELFGDKQACFLEACRVFAKDLVDHVFGALQEAGSWRAAVHAGMEEFLRYLAGHPTSTRACLVEGFSAGPEAVAIRDAAMRTFAGFLDVLQTWAPPGGRPRACVSQAMVGGIYETVMRRVRDRQETSLPMLASPLTYFLLAPVIGRRQASQEAGMSRPARVVRLPASGAGMALA